MASGGYYEGPITTWGRIPVYITTIVMAVEVAALLLGVLASIAPGLPFGVLQYFFIFEPGLTWPTFQVWRALLYPLVEIPSFSSIFGLIFLWFYGREMESYLGRKRTIIYYLILLIAPVIVSTLFWAIGQSPGVMSGGYFFGIGVIIGFATLYPRLEWYYGIQMRWIAIASVCLGAFSPLQGGNRLTALLTYLAACGAAWGYIRWLQLGAETPKLALGKFFRKGPKLKVVRGGESKPSRLSKKQEPGVDSSFKPGGSVPQAVVDQILEKVATQGIGSLSAKERQLLEKHSNDLKKRAGRA